MKKRVAPIARQARRKGLLNMQEMNDFNNRVPVEVLSRFHTTHVAHIRRAQNGDCIPDNDDMEEFVAGMKSLLEAQERGGYVHCCAKYSQPNSRAFNERHSSITSKRDAQVS